MQNRIEIYFSAIVSVASECEWTFKLVVRLSIQSVITV